MKSCLASKSDWTPKCVLPLCLARYRPRRIIEHSVTKTTTATIPPIRAWSGPVCPAKAFGSRGRDKEAKVILHRQKNDRKIHNTKFYSDHPENRAFPSLIFSTAIPTFTPSILSKTQCCLYSQIVKALRTSQLWKILPYSTLAEVIKWKRFLALSSSFYNWKPGHSYL